jgi:hypothetical protein
VKNPAAEPPRPTAELAESAKNARLFRWRLGEGPGKQFGEGGVGKIERLPAGKAPAHLQDLGCESIHRGPMAGAQGRGIGVGALQFGGGGKRGECHGGLVGKSKARGPRGIDTGARQCAADHGAHRRLGAP